MPTAKLIAKRPSSGELKNWDFPRFTKTTLDNGFQVIVAHAPGRPLAAAQLLFDSGASQESDQEGGVAGITADSLLAGTGKHKGSSFAQALEGLGADVQGVADWDTFKLDLQAPVSRLEPALELLAEAVRDPQLAWRDVDRHIQQRVGGILGQYANAQGRAVLAFDRLVYSPSSPYSRPAGGNFWTVSTMGKKSVKKYHQAFITPGAATLILVGDLEGFPAEKVAEKYFGGWKAKESQRTQRPVSENLGGNSVTLVHRPEAEQSHIMLGHVGAPRSTPDFFPISVVATALGGIFDSRLNRVLREEKGFTYGVGGGFDWRRQAGPFRVSTAVDTDVTIDAIAATIDVLDELASKGLDKEELATVKGFLTGAFVLRLEDPQAIANALANMVTYRLPEDYYDSYRTNIENVTLEEANAAAQEYVRPNRLGIVVVGDADKVNTPLRNAEFGPVANITDPEPGNPPTH